MIWRLTVKGLEIPLSAPQYYTSAEEALKNVSKDYYSFIEVISNAEALEFCIANDIAVALPMLEEEICEALNELS